jgi:hypothetical protein
MLQKFVFGMFAMASLASINAQETNGFKDFIAPVSNPIYFESALHTTEIRTIVIKQDIHESIPTVLGRTKLGGTLMLYAVQARYQIDERLSLIATKDGYADVDYDNTLKDKSGFADLALGLKYSPIIDHDSQFALTIGGRIEIPTGDDEVFQGSGDGIVNPFISVAKGYGNIHLAAYEGVRLPIDTDAQSTINDFSLHVDYKIGNFYPLAEFNWRHILASGNGGENTVDVIGVADGIPLDTVNPNIEGVDIASLGTSDSQGQNYTNFALGFRYKFNDAMNMGCTWESPLSDNDQGIFDERYTVDFIYSF